MFKAMVGISDDADGARYEPGEAVPAAVVKRAPWLLEQGHVVDTKKATAPDQLAELTEDTVADEPVAEEA